MPDISEIPLLPTYSPSPPAPRYSHEPACDEQRLDHTPNTHRRTPRGSFIKKSSKVTIVLDNQEDGASIPVFGRNANISGTICIDGYPAASSVLMKINAKTEATSSEIGALTLKLLDNTYVLWSSCAARQEAKQTGQDVSTVPACPSHVPFSIALPSTFIHEGESLPLPSSYRVAFPGVPGLFVKIAYTVSIVITGIKRRHLGFLTKTKTIHIPFKYYPRTRSHRPIIRGPCFYHALKAMPEEWYQSTGTMKSRRASDIKPIQAHLFVPAGRIYGLQDRIPFHVQLFGSIASLRELLLGAAADPTLLQHRHRGGLLERMTTFESKFTAPSRPSSRPPSRSKPFSRPPSRSADLQNTASLMSPLSTVLTATTVDSGLSIQSNVPEPFNPSVKVYILRQVCLEARGEKAWRNVILGRGELVPIPPSWYNGSGCCLGSNWAGQEHREESLDWEGEVRCDADLAEVGSFSAGPVSVKDFIVLALSSPRPNSALVDLQQAISVRLVTDAWVDVDNSEVRMAA